ncbi:hypothetical protein CANINC_004917 [Pichia inconspicua]|uniref:Uncharacterized protein n=1 Tax=Pichia inconspicua TaxID=52247 RepID=A0A4T0WVC1_9ASCO|nr:hypothetical protein CANINC_004917 [[Candida] inconspicua]
MFTHMHLKPPFSEGNYYSPTSRSISRPFKSSTQQQYPSSYISRYPLYGLDWSFDTTDSTPLIALSSYRDDSTNKLEILNGSQSIIPAPPLSPTSKSCSSQSYNFSLISDHSIKYPITRLQWDPSMSSKNNSNQQLLATTSECLRIYQLCDSDSDNSKKLIEKSALTNSKITNLNQLPPMTSFDWNSFDPTSLITCSIDTTCTAWNLVKETFVAKSQLIAHDSEVYDVKYIYGDKNVFASCSSDGSVRLFDLRNLEQSTIIYDNTLNGNSKTLLRLASSHYNANQIALLTQDSSNVIILDLRNVGVPVYSLNHSSAPVDSIAWHPTKNLLLTGSDSMQVLLYDFSIQQSNQLSPTNSPISTNIDDYMHSNKNHLPSYKFDAQMEVNNVCWSPDGQCAGFNSGKCFQSVMFSPS